MADFGVGVAVTTDIEFSEPFVDPTEGIEVTVSTDISWDGDDERLTYGILYDAPGPTFPQASISGGLLTLVASTYQTPPPSTPAFSLAGPVISTTIDSEPTFPQAVMTGGTLFLTASTLDVDSPSFPQVVQPRFLTASIVDVSPPTLPNVGLADAILSASIVEAPTPTIPTSAMGEPYIAILTLEQEPTFPMARITVQIPVVLPPRITYQLILTGAADSLTDLDLSDRLANFQNFLNTDSPSFMSASVRVDSDTIDEIELRSNGELVIKRLAHIYDGSTITSEIARVSFDTLRADRGSSSHTATVSGEKAVPFGGAAIIPIQGTSTRSSQGSTITIRGQIDSNLKPGDTATFEAESVTVTSIKHIFAEKVQFMDVVGTSNG